MDSNARVEEGVDEVDDDARDDDARRGQNPPHR
jgi:hypothetical protein